MALLSNYTANKYLLNECWAEIEEQYAAGARYYHTLQHLNHLLAQLTAVKGKIMSWDAILFTLYYHDIIYDVLRSDNEAQSAQLAEKRLKQLSVPLSVIELCKKQILATQAHLEAADPDTNYFTDADLSILGAEWESYALYYKNVRKEYSVYPGPVYNAGRKKVLGHFLSMDRIFKTDYFYDKFETRARENLVKELHELG
jgi:predicted metal-dependent HD superfamily phosphohydrolase